MITEDAITLFSPIHAADAAASATISGDILYAALLLDIY